jgi:ubiquitin-activating enzyme E1
MILTGGKQVTIHDPTPATIADAGSNFYINESQAGKVSRAEACISQLKELNPYMDVSVLKEPLNNDTLKKYSLIFVTELILPWAELVKVNEFCRSQAQPIGFIMCLTLGLYGTTFVDFGPKFIVKDTTGESTNSYIVVYVSKGNPGVVRLHEDKKHNYNDGDYVKFKEIGGMTELNDAQPMQIKVVDKLSFSIGDTSKFNDYTRGGIVENVKMPVEVKFKSLVQSLEQPLKSADDMLINADLRLFGRAEQLHIGFCAILKYYEKHNSLPELNNLGQAEEVVKLAIALNEDHKAKKAFSVEKVEEEVVKNMALYARAQITSVCSFFGGVAAQEGFKSVGKYNPIQQWLHYDCFESLPVTKVNRKLMKSRYDDLIAIYGQEVLEQLQNLKLLMVGAGALGCELVKAFALLGVATKDGHLTLTDNDNIELSNLSRQFLFRQKDIGQPKSQTAANVAVKANPKFHVKALKDFVAPSTEHIFTEDFWDNLDMVIGAVDNIKARLYMDAKCVWHSKPLIDAGTLGTKANTQVVMPKLTQSYSDSMDPAEEEFPMCTIRNFPNLIEHTIEWARSQFEGYFNETPRNTADYIKNTESFLRRIAQGTTITGMIEALKNILELINLKKANSFDACIKFAREKFEEHFHSTIAQLLYNFPPDYKDEYGNPFWTGPKRTPKIIDFDPNDKLHMLYIQACAIVVAGVLKIPIAKEQRTLDYIIKASAVIKLPKFVPKNIKISFEENPDPAQDLLGNEEEEAAKVKEELKVAAKGLKESDFEPIDFEKDDDNNFHVDYVHAAANLRARSYTIAECDKLKTRGIAGRIIPAIATATAMIVGSLCNEIIKAAQKFDKVELYKAAFVNLALPMFVFSEPPPAVLIKSKEFDVVMGGPIKAIPEGHTKWEKIVLQGPLTINELEKKLKEEYKISLSMVGCGDKTLYMELMSPKERKAMQIEKILEEVSKEKILPTVKSLKVDVMGETLDTSTTAIVPSIKYILKK